MNLLRYIAVLFVFLIASCSDEQDNASDTLQLLSSQNSKAVAYGGYRTNNRQVQPSLTQIKEDLRILHAMGVNWVRTYNLQFDHAYNVVRAIEELQQENPDFKMYVMLGVWINCKNAWTGLPVDHTQEDPDNKNEVARGIAFAKAYPNIIKVLALGNEAMVRWASSYRVTPAIILKYVNQVQNLKKEGGFPKGTLVTTSDNYAAWGALEEYRNKNLILLIKAVDYLSVHTYPMHDTHYQPEFWQRTSDTIHKLKRVDHLMDESLKYAVNQIRQVQNYLNELEIKKPIHIGETGWASRDNGLYNSLNGTAAADEYKSGIYYHKISNWSREQGMTCFYFEAFDEPWKNASNANGSENHFGLFTVTGKAKYALWHEVDNGVFKTLSRDGNPIVKTYKGDLEKLVQDVHLPKPNTAN